MKIDPQDIFETLRPESQDDLVSRYLDLHGKPDFVEKAAEYAEVAVALIKEHNISALPTDPRRLDVDSRLRNAHELVDAISVLDKMLAMSLLLPEVLTFIGRVATEEQRQVLRKVSGMEPPEATMAPQDAGLYDVARALSLALKVGALGQQLLDRKVEPDVLAGRAAREARRRGKERQAETVGARWKRVEAACERETRRLITEGFSPGRVVDGRTVTRNALAERVASQVNRNLGLAEGTPSSKTVLRLMKKLGI